ncbi:MAG: hypothetical protein ACOC10_09765 [Bacteroidota bacterium]
MKHKHWHIIFLAIFFNFAACNKDEAPVLTGDIKGTVTLTDKYGYQLEDKSGVQVQITAEELFEENVTDVDGRYSFENMPFGTYHINLIKENYFESILDFRLNHVGGDVPTLTSQFMTQLNQEYSFAIDSIIYEGFQFNIYLHGIDMDKPIKSMRHIHFFFSESPDVSAENFNHSFIQFFYPLPGPNEYAVYWYWWDGYRNFLYDYSDTIYCRVYPQTYYQEMWSINPDGSKRVIPESLGKPSDVFAFTLDEITREYIVF